MMSSFGKVFHVEKRWKLIREMGCGAYGCPPDRVSQEMKTILKDDEFKGWFRLVTFAVFSKKEPGFVGSDNYDVFSKAFKNVEV